MIYVYIYICIFFYNIKLLSKLFNYFINIKENRYYKANLKIFICSIQVNIIVCE